MKKLNQFLKIKKMNKLKELVYNLKNYKNKIKN